MKLRAYAVLGWLGVGALGLALCPLLWSMLTHQTTSSCYGLWDGVPTSALVVMPLRTWWRSPELWLCVLPFVATPIVGLGLVVRRPRGWGWLVVGGGWLSYSVGAVLLAGVGC